MRRTAYIETCDGDRAAFYVDGVLAIQGEGQPAPSGRCIADEDLFDVLEEHGLLDGAVEASAGEYDTSDDPGLASFGGLFPESLEDLVAAGRVSWSI